LFSLYQPGPDTWDAAYACAIGGEKKQSNSLPHFANAQKTMRCERIEV